MPKYDSSNDADLKNSNQVALEKFFFLRQYRKRKFLIDNNVLFDETALDAARNLFSCTEMNHRDARSMYRRLCEDISTFLLPSVSIEYDESKCNVIDFLSEKIIETVNGLQWYLAVYENNILQKGINIQRYNKDIYRVLLESQEIKNMIEQLTYISLRYGLLITDLCSDFPDIVIKSRVDKNDPSLEMVFFYYADFDSRKNPHILPKDDSLNKKRLLTALEDNDAGKKIGKLEASAFKKAISNIVPGSLYSNSILKRKVGLWLWDRCESPLIEKKIPKMEALEELKKHKFFREIKNNSFTRDMHRIYNTTIACIESGEIKAIENASNKSGK